ncbi:hypothetical protein K490DRAFT_61245 [Saccharata proteae CBS 121410]|uniref:Protein kinase domain-containing protein n=1 Tax=Saccharata proteae CBS 121410 TaxID=1314787 RepID=A0A9P4I323_9PEZI|nr:hypothetical protein K490DRAFT_61245 [Saccharata proteae CBS 121410]
MPRAVSNFTNFRNAHKDWVERATPGWAAGSRYQTIRYYWSTLNANQKNAYTGAQNTWPTQFPGTIPAVPPPVKGKADVDQFFQNLENFDVARGSYTRVKENARARHQRFLDSLKERYPDDPFPSLINLAYKINRDDPDDDGQNYPDDDYWRDPDDSTAVASREFQPHEIPNVPEFQGKWKFWGEIGSGSFGRVTLWKKKSDQTPIETPQGPQHLAIKWQLNHTADVRRPIQQGRHTDAGYEIITLRNHFGPQHWRERLLLETAFTQRMSVVHEHEDRQYTVKLYGYDNRVELLGTPWNPSVHQCITNRLYQEYYNYGNLHDLIARMGEEGYTRRNPTPTPFLYHCFLSLIHAVLMMEKGSPGKKNKLPGWVPLIHGDLKADNVFLGDAKENGIGVWIYPTIHVADWGCSHEVRDVTGPENAPDGGFRRHLPWEWVDPITLNESIRKYKYSWLTQLPFKGNLRVYDDTEVAKVDGKANVYGIACIMFSLIESSDERMPKVGDKKTYVQDEYGLIDPVETGKAWNERFFSYTASVAAYEQDDMLQTIVDLLRLCLHPNPRVRPTPAVLLDQLESSVGKQQILMGKHASSNWRVAPRTPPHNHWEHWYWRPGGDDVQVQHWKDVSVPWGPLVRERGSEDSDEDGDEDGDGYAYQGGDEDGDGYAYQDGDEDGGEDGDEDGGEDGDGYAYEVFDDNGDWDDNPAS